MTPTIQTVQAWQALDSRGHPTVAARVTLSDGAAGTALAPSGASAGSHEAVELRDGASSYGGRSVHGAVQTVRTDIADLLAGLAVDLVDATLAGADRSEGFARVGANAVVAVSIAAARAAAAAHGTSLARYLARDEPADQALLLPMPMVNVLSGGAHAGDALDIQDALVIPVGASSFAEAIEWAATVRERAAALATERGYPTARLVADEGGLGLTLATNRSALELLSDAIEASGYALGEQVALAVDVAATQLFHGSRYRLAREQRVLGSTELIEELIQWCESFPLVSIEDLLAEDDWDGWRAATAALADKAELVGDDLFVTSPERLRQGIAAGVATSVLVKVNQNGLLSGAREVVELARTAGYRTVVSARSGDTEDSWLADLSVAWRAGQIKVGSTHRSERTAKWNRLLELESTERTLFAGPWPGGRPPCREIT